MIASLRSRQPSVFRLYTPARAGIDLNQSGLDRLREVESGPTPMLRRQRLH